MDRIWLQFRLQLLLDNSGYFCPSTSTVLAAISNARCCNVTHSCQRLASSAFARRVAGRPASSPSMRKPNPDEPPTTLRLPLTTFQLSPLAIPSPTSTPPTVTGRACISGTTTTHAPPVAPTQRSLVPQAMTEAVVPLFYQIARTGLPPSSSGPLWCVAGSK